jgi:hypothetical protein
MINKEPKKPNWFLVLFLGSLILKLSYFIFGRKKRTVKLKNIKNNFNDFIISEKKELNKLEKGEDSLGHYCRKSFSTFSDYFIPNRCNNHKPKILRTHSLAVILLSLIIVKTFLTGYLFFIYPNQAKMEGQIVNEILVMINADRQKNNLGPLTLNPALSSSALAKADNMIAENYFAHYGPNGKKPWDWINRINYPYLFVGENLAMNFTSANTAHTALMDSPSHKKNILNDKYNDIGLAVVSGEINGKKTNILVELFASQNKPAIVLKTNLDYTAGTTKTANVKAPNNQTKVLSTSNIKSAKNPPIKPAQIASAKPVSTISKPPAISSGEIATSSLISTSSPAITSSTPEKLIASNVSSSTISILEEKISQDSNAKQKQAFIAELASKSDNFISPNPDLEFNSASKVEFKTPNIQGQSKITFFIEWSRYLYFGFLFLIIASLLVNILVRATIQHKPIIIEAIIVIIFISGLITMKLHFLEYITDKIGII